MRVPFFGLPAVALVLAVASLFSAGCNRQLEMITDAPDPEEIPPTDPENIALFYQISPDQAENLMKNNRELVIVDFRSPEAFAKGHLPGATSLPWPAENFEAFFQPLDRKTKVFAYSDYTPDHFNGVLKVREMGFLDVYWLSYGFPSWVDAGKSIIDFEGQTVPRDIAEALSAAEKEAGGVAP